ncbi:MAG: type VI secretion system contractile sheath large subunit, partial [Candidatus Poribacteria bacterium]
AAAHCPFIAATKPSMFGVGSVDKIPNIPDLEPIFEMGQYTKWRSFREMEDSRYVGLTFPRFLVRTPYGPEENPVKGFTYVENVKEADHDKYLWGNASFALAANMTRSFEQNGWCVQIRGPESGGLVGNLPVHMYEVNGNRQVKIPTEITITDRREFELSELGIIPLSWYRNTDYAVFFSANSTQKPKTYTGPDGAEATANSRLCSRLPYIFLVSRLAHYLKAMQRQKIGGYADSSTLQQDLQNWINGLVTGTPNPSPSIIAQRPLKEAQITVTDIEENPGFFKVDIYVRPHIQLEGMDIGLSIVSQMPKAK